VAVAFAVLSVQLVCAASERSAAIGRLIQNGQFERARQALATALETDRNDADLWNLLGVVNAQENRTAAAEEAFLKAVRFAPELGGAWLNLGRLYTLTAGEDKKAETKGIAAYETVLRLDPANAEAHHQLALLLQWKGKFRESLGQLNLLPAEDREKRSAIVLRCADEAALGNSKVASELAEQLLRDRELEEGDIAAILPVVESRNEMITLRLLEGLKERRLATDRTLPHLAALYERRGNLQGARKVYESAFENSPAPARMLLELARVAWKERDYEGTLGYLAHARDLEPKNARIHFLFGLTCNEMKLPIEARKSLEAAVELVPDNPYYTYATGAVLLQWTDKSQAIPFLKRFVALQPGDARGHLARARAGQIRGTAPACKPANTCRRRVPPGADCCIAGRPGKRDRPFPERYRC
jgi:tetratricopeptide (TPR) repeat protein